VENEASIVTRRGSRGKCTARPSRGKAHLTPDAESGAVARVSRVQRIELLLFTASFVAFAYFNQGGGWNQNARFAEVRAMAEQGRFAIDDYLVYRPLPDGTDLQRVPVRDAEYSVNGKRFRLCWVDMVWNLFPVGDHPLEEGVEKAPMVEICASGDIGYVPQTGHFHPNKPPGTSFTGLPAYLIIYWVERGLGINPDHWWTLNINAWLTTVCSVGLLSAIATLLFFRLARGFIGGRLLPALLATIAFALGTTFFPFATLLFDHNLTAAFMLAAFYFVCPLGARANRRAPLNDNVAAREERNHSIELVLAGFCAGFAAITNYVAAVVVIFLGLYVLLGIRSERISRRPWRDLLLFGVGVLGPFLAICWYGWTCFGSPFRLNTDFQNPLFKDPHGALGMFARPNLYVAALLIASPFRGLFLLAPVLLFGIYGLIQWMREKRFIPETRLCCGIFTFFFLVNICFNGYHGGFAAGPRYLVPGIPFLALPMVAGFVRWPRFASLIGLISIGLQLLLTATDAQNPVGVGGHARIEGHRDEWAYNLIGDYAWPLFLYERAWPLLEGQLAVQMEKEEDRIAADVADPAEQSQRAVALRNALREGIKRGDPSPFLLATVDGPVGVNPIGIYEGLFTYGLFPPFSAPTRWASFNAGEFLFPDSRWSLLPLLIITGGLLTVAVRTAKVVDVSRVILSAAPPGDMEGGAESKNPVA
jgi:hypothetical protein